LAACLLARSISIAQAVVHLVGLDHVVEARMLARSIFESECYLYRLAQDDGRAFAREMKADEAHHHRALGEAIKTTLDDEEGRSRVQKIIDWSLQKSPKAKKLLTPGRHRVRYPTPSIALRPESRATRAFGLLDGTSRPICLP
jgi:Family of unknown function (DUF5677)